MTEPRETTTRNSAEDVLANGAPGKTPTAPISEFTVMPVDSAPGMLQAAFQHMLDRAAVYDSPEGERSMGKTIDIFNTITGRDLTEAEGWLIMQILKDVRQWSREGYHQDSAEDSIAYAALKSEALAGGR